MRSAPQAREENVIGLGAKRRYVQASRPLWGLGVVVGRGARRVPLNPLKRAQRGGLPSHTLPLRALKGLGALVVAQLKGPLPWLLCCTVYTFAPLGPQET